jgi:hypothetical protein
MICVLETAASYGPKSALVLDEPVYKHGSEVADRLVMTSAEVVIFLGFQNGPMWVAKWSIMKLLSSPLI